MAAGFQPSSDFAADRRVFFQTRLVENLDLVTLLDQFSNTPIPMPDGSGTTVTMVKYARLSLPMAPLSPEGQTPNSTPMSPSTQQATVDEWGMWVAFTTKALITTQHPILNISLKLLGEAMGLTTEYNLHEMMARATNRQYADGRANRAAIVAGDYITAQMMVRARVGFEGNGATPRGGNIYAAVTDPYVLGDIQMDSGTNGWAAVHQYSGDVSALEKGVAGRWLGFQWYSSNFFPVLTRLAAINDTPTTGGSLSGTVYFKWTRRGTARGFEETIGVEDSTVMGGNTRLQFPTPSDAGYVYNLYAGSVTGDSNLFIAAQNVLPSTTVNLDVLPTSGLTPPETPPNAVPVHLIYFFGNDFFDTVELNQNSMTPTATRGGATDSDPLGQRRTAGCKWNTKPSIRDQARGKVLEVSTRFNA